MHTPYKAGLMFTHCMKHMILGAAVSIQTPAFPKQYLLASQLSMQILAAIGTVQEFTAKELN